MKKPYLFVMIYLCAGALLLPLYRYVAVTDIVPYLSIAQKYITGDYFNAVNGVWGVLISWLSIPFLLANIEPFLAFKIMNLIIGAVAMLGLFKLSSRFSLSSRSQLILLGTAVPLILSFSLLVTTPDLLVLTVLLFYFYYIFDPEYYQSYKNAIIVGLLGGVGYLSKHYVFCFIAIHLVAMHLFHFIYKFREKKDRLKVLIKFVISFFIFALISSVWIGILSNKYGYATFGTSVEYNRAWRAPSSLGHVPEYSGITPPPNDTATSMWEDLTYYVELMPNNDWSPFASTDELKHQLGLIVKNIGQTMVMYSELSLLLWPTLFIIGIGSLIIFKPKRKVWLDPIFLSFFSLLLYSSGYLLIITSDRYLWIVASLLLLMSFYFYDKLSYWLKKYENDLGWLKLMHVFIISVVIMSFLAFPLRRLIINIDRDKHLYEIGTMFKEKNLDGSIISNGSWSNTLLLAYHAGLTYYGMPAKNSDIEKIYNDIKKNNINYVIIWGAAESKWDLILNEAIYEDQENNYKLYKLN